MTLAVDDFRFGLITDRMTAEVIRDLTLLVSQLRAGTVTSVGLTAPTIFAVGGSPVTSSGTLALSLATQTANRVWAGPSSGAATTPTFRALVAADLPAGTGTVTSAAMTVPSFLSVSGSPITTSGTFAVSLATQTASTIFAGPTSGASSVPTFRALVAADLPVASVRTATTTPVTVTAAEAAAGAFIVCRLAAPGAVAVSLPAGVTGYRVTVKDGTGDASVNNITVTPAAGNIDGAATNVIASDYAARTYVYDGTEWVVV